jgi:hypothetical protein
MRLALKGSCSSCEENGGELAYHWTYLSRHHTLEWGKHTKTEQSSQNLVIESGFFEGGQHYKFMLTISKESGLNSSSEYHVNVNSPPSNGSCSISPSNGTAMDTKYKVTCNDWLVSLANSAPSYRVSMIKETSQKRGLLRDGPSPDMEFTLTSGRKDDEYNVSTVVEVVDIFQATTEYMLQTVQVRPMFEFSADTGSNEEEVNVEEKLLESSSGTLDKLVGEGGSQQISQFVMGMSDILNTVNTEEEKEETEIKKEDNVKSSNAKEDGDKNSSEEKKKAEVKSVKSEEEKRKEEERRRKKKAEEEERKRKATEARKKMRSSMVKALSKVKVESVANIKQAADAFETVLSSPKEVTPESQSSALSSMESMVNVLQSDEDTVKG